MKKTLKSEIITITLSMLLILFVVFALFAFLYYKDTELLMLNFTSKNIMTYANNINKEVIKIEKNAYDLALMGELYYKFDRNKSIAEKTIVQVFDNYPESLGGGVWFKPYVVDRSKRLLCMYAYRNKHGNVVFDPKFESEEYNYPDKSWYKEIFPFINKKDNIEWSRPYYEKEGSDTVMITAGAGMYDNEGNLVGLSTVDWEVNSVIKTISAIKPSKNSFSLFANPSKDYVIVTNDPYLKDKALVGASLKNIPWYNDNLINVRYMTYQNKEFIPYVKILDNEMILIVCVPKNEFLAKMFHSITIFCILLTFLALFLAYIVYSGLRKNIMYPIGKLIYIANKISKGDNDIEIKIENPVEFEKLASTFDKMTRDIKNITKEKERINSELNIAKSIQISSLPSVFPPFPDRQEFDIYASMDTAKEVGGDFYDFYFMDENHIMFIIADVSGKGVPAALFMMTAKTLINNISQIVKDPSDIIEQINNKICASNKNGFFITLFAGIVDLRTGKMSCINCGHNPPLILTNDGKYKYMDLDQNVALGVFENMNFKIVDINLNPGDIILTYTDGVTEALNENDDMYGEDRLKDCLNKNKDITNIKDIINTIKNDVKQFSGSVSQSDDMTMLIFKYYGSENPNHKYCKVLANKDNYKVFYEFIHNFCNEWKISEDISNKMDMCAEEIYANTEFYAYKNVHEGYIELYVTKEDNKIILEFRNNGVEYNPLKRSDPDITLPPEKRSLGGLGIYMIKQMSDEISYQYIDGINILKLTFVNNS
ncbi:SpoIIE family protein phosphatase [bacterium]|nr:SpoIIE family protein phosphatase [bacterium]